jgi:hypothetical protein
MLTITGPDDDLPGKATCGELHGQRSRLGVDVGRLANHGYGRWFAQQPGPRRRSYDLSEHTSVGFDGSWIKNEEAPFNPATTAKIVGASGAMNWTNLEPGWSPSGVIRITIMSDHRLPKPDQPDLHTHPDF